MLRKIGTELLEANIRGSLYNSSHFFHSANCLNSRGFTLEKEYCSKWKSYNDKIFPPQEPGEERRPAYVCHVNENIKYSYKKMWYIAAFIRGMSVEEALKQLQFIHKKGAAIARETLLEAQEIAVKDHNVEFKSNLWVSESFVGKGMHLTGYRRHAFGKIAKLYLGYVHHFVTLEEGEPPEYYYVHKKPKTSEEWLTEWLDQMRKRKVYGSY